MGCPRLAAACSSLACFLACPWLAPSALAPCPLQYDDPAHLRLGAHAFEGAEILVTRGDYAPIMARVVGHLAAAQGVAANAAQVRMLSRYIDSFRTGSQEAHIDGSRDWVQDKGPAVESYIGFIEVR